MANKPDVPTPAPEQAAAAAAAPAADATAARPDVAAAEAAPDYETPYPTQAHIDRVKRGLHHETEEVRAGRQGYDNRQVRSL